jgi:hypothetical protein
MGEGTRIDEGGSKEVGRRSQTIEGVLWGLFYHDSTMILPKATLRMTLVP